MLLILFFFFGGPSAYDESLGVSFCISQVLSDALSVKDWTYLEARYGLRDYRNVFMILFLSKNIFKLFLSFDLFIKIYLCVN